MVLNDAASPVWSASIVGGIAPIKMSWPCELAASTSERGIGSKVLPRKPLRGLRAPCRLRGKHADGDDCPLGLPSKVFKACPCRASLRRKLGIERGTSRCLVGSLDCGSSDRPPPAHSRDPQQRLAPKPSRTSRRRQLLAGNLLAHSRCVHAF